MPFQIDWTIFVTGLFQDRISKVWKKPKLYVQFPLKPKHYLPRRLDPSRWNYVGLDEMFIHLLLRMSLVVYTWYHEESHVKIACKSVVFFCFSCLVGKQYSTRKVVLSPEICLACLMLCYPNGLFWVYPWMAVGIIGLLTFETCH